MGNGCLYKAGHAVHLHQSCNNFPSPLSDGAFVLLPSHMYVRNCYKKLPELRVSHKIFKAISTHLCVRVSVHDLCGVLQYNPYSRNKSVCVHFPHCFAAVDVVMRSKLRASLNAESSCCSSSDVVVGLRRKAIALPTTYPSAPTTPSRVFLLLRQSGGVRT